MAVLILKNISFEGPGTIEQFLEGRNIPNTIVDLSTGALPDADGFDTLVMMGGPMSVNDEDRYPYLTDEMRLAERFMRSGKRVLGVCLGAQLMAKALGARVYPGKETEIGWFDVTLVDAGIEDSFMSILAGGNNSFRAFHWHGETFDIPQGAERLASSELFPNQAFRFGKNSYAFQFHMEVTREMIFAWLKNEPIGMDVIQKDTGAAYSDYYARAQRFYEAFFLNAV